MKDGAIESEGDVRWLIAAGKYEYTPADVLVSALTPVGLWYAYELTRDSRTDDMKIGDQGHLLIFLGDEYAPGWYHYKKRTESDDAAREAVLRKFGDVVSVPLRAMLSKQPVGIW